MFTGSMPAITPAQVLAVVTFVAGQAVAFGWVDPSREQTLISAGSTIVAVALKLADSYLRGERAKAVAANPGAFAGTPPQSSQTPRT
jgi:hypothetical protein